MALHVKPATQDGSSSLAIDVGTEEQWLNQLLARASFVAEANMYRMQNVNQGSVVTLVWPCGQLPVALRSHLSGLVAELPVALWSHLSGLVATLPVALWSHLSGPVATLLVALLSHLSGLVATLLVALWSHLSGLVATLHMALWSCGHTSVETT
eukprot:gene15910-22044_t